MPWYSKPHFRRRDGRSYRVGTRYGPYTPLQVMSAYNIPTTYTGWGVKVGILEFGGAFSASDYATFMSQLGHTNYLPVQVKSVQGGQQQPDPGGADIEVMMDCEIVGAMAPGAQIICYFAPNQEDGFAAAIMQALQDNCQVLSLSWGAPERSWSATGRAQVDKALQQCQAQHVNVFVAAGDNGASDGLSGLNCDYPASSPYSIGCGGTSLYYVPGVERREVVWNDGSQGGATGGGYSVFYATPPFQAPLGLSSRGVPDVAGVADPETPWAVYVGGQPAQVGGTSAVAPMWAAINALWLEKYHFQNFTITELYQNPNVFFDVTQGSN